MNAIRAVFLDAGHTLIYAYPSLGEVYARVTREWGPVLDPELFYSEFLTAFQNATLPFSRTPSSALSSDDQDRRMWMDITREVYDRLPQIHSIPFPAWFERLYDTFGRADSWRLYPEAADALTVLKKTGIRMGIVSNWDSRLKNIVEGLGLMQWMDFALISAEVGYRKPHPAIFQEALRRAGVSAEEAVHVGDSVEEDIVGAKGAGIRAILVDRRKKQTIAEGARVIPDLSGLAECVVTSW